MKKIGFVIAVAFLCTACSKSPMEKLKSDVRYPELNEPFWSKEEKLKTALWVEALNYCKVNKAKLNCAPLMTIAVLRNGNTKFIPLNSHPIKSPLMKD